MDDFKLVRLNAINPAITNEIITIDGAALKVQLTRLLGIPQASTGIEIVTEIQKQARKVSGTYINNGDINLKDLFKKLSLDIPARVYLNWRHLDTVDIIDSDVLCEYFDDIWYPSSDDIDIIDIDVKWVITVDHDGYLKFLLLVG